MIKKLMYKWFGLVDDPCESCEILRERLDESERERRELLHRLLDKDKPEPPSTEKEEHIPIGPQFTPWRVRQQMLEQEDRQAAKIMRERARDISQLESELGIAHAVDRGESGGVKSNASQIS